MEAASVVVFPFVQCGLVAPVIVDGSPDNKSSCSVGVNVFTGRELMVSQVVGLVAPFAVRSWWLYCVGLG